MVRFSFCTLEFINSCIERALPYTSSGSFNRPYFGPVLLLARDTWDEIALKSDGAAIGVRDAGVDAIFGLLFPRTCVPQHVIDATKIEYFALNVSAENSFETIQ